MYDHFGRVAARKNGLPDRTGRPCGWRKRVGGTNVSLKWDTIRPSGSLAFGRLASLAFGRLATLAFGRSATLTFGLAEFLLALLAEFVALVVVEPFAGRLFGTQRP